MIASHKINGARAVEAVSHFVLLPHVLPALNQNIRTLVGMHRLLQGIETGSIGVFTAEQESRIIGISWGQMENPEDWINHFAFERGTDTLGGCRAMIKQIKKHYGAIRITGYIPECHRAAKLLTRRLGFADCGIMPEYIHEDMNGREYICRKFTMEI